MIAVVGRESRMVEEELGIVALPLQLEADDRIDALRPGAGAPSLDDALVGHQLDIASRDHSAETRKGASRGPIDLGWCVGEFAELLGIEQRVEDALRAGIEDDLLVN